MKPAAIGAKALGLFLPTATARRFALPGFIAVCVLTAVAGWGVFQVWDWWDDRKAVQEDRDKANAEFTAKQLEAERNAGADKRERDAQDDQDNKELNDEIDQADRDNRTAADDIWNGGLFDPAN